MTFQYDEKSFMTIERLGNSTPSGIQDLYNNHLFSGEENLLRLSRTFTTEFICNYELRNYPFDTQVCTMVFVMKVLTAKLIPFEKNNHNIEFIYREHQDTWLIWSVVP